MFRFLKGLMKAGAPPGAIGIDELPAWIGGEESRVRADLARLVRDHRAVVLQARERLEDVLSGFGAASMEEVSHRKLAGVTERSLPLFLRAMRTSLSHDLPGDPEGFYASVGEILKGCLSAFRGQGKYLASRFPEEMRILRDGVDTIGREVNELTPEISRARDRLRELGELKNSLERYDGAQRQVTLWREEIHSLEEEADRSRRSLDGVNQALAALEKGEEYLTCREEILRVGGLEGELADTLRLYRSATAPAIHLLRKGEKIASRRKDSEAGRVLREAIGLLEAEPPVPEETASRILLSGQMAMASMVASGDLTLKNREEIDLMGDPDRFAREVTELSHRFRRVSGEITSARNALLSLPALVKSRDLKKEGEDLENQIARATDRLKHVEGEGAGLERRMHESLEDLQGRVETLSGWPLKIPTGPGMADGPAD
jgi:predicted  nucleic acid-binding Zn-ribbon protein